MVLRLSAHAQQNAVRGAKRKHTEVESSSMFKTLDRADRTNTAPTKPCTMIGSEVKVEPLHTYFTNMLQSRGYAGTTHSTLCCGYNNKPTLHQISSYGLAFTDAIRSSNFQKVKTFLFESGLSPNACNKFGESVVHLVCRRSNHVMLQVFLDAGCSVQVCDDFGRTPLHDACWTSTPNFELISMLLDQDPWLLLLKDRRGTTPFGYVKYESSCFLWKEYLEEVADKYWPNRENVNPHEISNWAELKALRDARPCRAPLVLMKPNSRPISDPKLVSSLEVLEQVANGLEPQDGKKSQCEHIGSIKRITHDPTKVKQLTVS